VVPAPKCSSFELAELFFVAADIAGDGLQGGARSDTSMSYATCSPASLAARGRESLAPPRLRRYPAMSTSTSCGRPGPREFWPSVAGHLCDERPERIVGLGERGDDGHFLLASAQHRQRILLVADVAERERT